MSQADDLPIEDMPVHTMKKDLEAIKHPELAKAEIEYPETSARTQSINREKLTETQKDSPFLDFSAPKKAAIEETEPRIKTAKPVISDSRIKIVEPASQSEKDAVPQNLPVSNYEQPIFNSEKSSPETKQHPHHINFSKVFAAVIAVLIIAIIAGGGYYFWTTRQNAEEVVVTPPITEPEPEPTPEPVVAKFSTDKPNDLQINPAFNKTQIQDVIEQSGVAIAQAKIATPVEFVVSDQNNNPLTFKVFAKQMELTLSQNLLNQLGDKFSLFVYYHAQDNDYRTGLAIDIKSAGSLKNILKNEEAKFISEIEPIYILSFGQSSNDTPYKGSLYNGVEIRYKNIQDPESLSLDYAIFNDKLVIGTTKMTFRSIIDYLKPELE